MQMLDLDNVSSLRGRVCLITGGTRGIGLAVAEGLIGRGAEVLVSGRDVTAGAMAVNRLASNAAEGGKARFLPVDFSSQASVRTLAAQVCRAHPALHLLVHNAASVRPDWQLTVDGVEAQFAINHLASVLLTYQLLPLLRAASAAASAAAGATAGAARIVVTASQVERNADQSFAPLACRAPLVGYVANRVYAQTKLANMLFCRSLSEQLAAASSGVTVNALHPGVVRTQLLDALEQPRRLALGSPAPGSLVQRHLGDLGRLLRGGTGRLLRAAGMRPPVRDWATSAADGARTTLAVALAPALAGVSGRYFVDSREAEPSSASCDAVLAQSLWSLSMRCLDLPVDWRPRIAAGAASAAPDNSHTGHGHE